MKCKCLSYNKGYSNKLDGKLKKKFKNIFKFSNSDVNKFILLLRKPFILMNIWMIGKFNETTLPEKEELCSYLNLEEITDADYIMENEFI